MTVTTFPVESSGDTLFAISQESIRSIFTAVEAELYRSEVYQRAFSSLQRNLGEGDRAQILVRAVGREAIRLALRYLVRQSPSQTVDVSSQPAPSTEPVEDASSNLQPAIATSQSYEVQAVPPAPVTTSKYYEVQTAPPSPVIESSVQPMEPVDVALVPASLEGVPQRAKAVVRKAAKKAEVNDPVIRQREALLKQLGQELRQARIAKSISIQQLHTRTWVPLHQIKALEEGDIDQLPEDIYIRGFIERIGNALDLDGEHLATSLPSLDPAKTTVIPSWQQTFKPQKQLSPVHLYVGYATLMAGALAGLSWMTQQSLPDQVSEANTPTPTGAETNHSHRSQASVHSPTSSSRATGIATPETMPF